MAFGDDGIGLKARGQGVPLLLVVYPCLLGRRRGVPPQRMVEPPGGCGVGRLDPAGARNGQRRVPEDVHGSNAEEE